jgi:hypothetical protein
VNPEELEVAPGTAHETLEGLVLQSASEEELRAALEKAFDYRGDVTITKKDGATVDGYIFDRHAGPNLAESFVRVIPRETGPKNQRVKISVPWSEIVGLAFSGRDMAAGKSWEAWLKNYAEKKAAGEKNIGLQPETLD